MVGDNEKFEQVRLFEEQQQLARQNEESKERKPKIKTAQKRLASLGLVIEDLSKYNEILDVGARDCEIEKAAEATGLHSVISVDRSFSDEVIASGRKVLNEDARKLSLESSGVDLALVGSSAYYYTKSEEETLAILHEINRVLKEFGEQRVYPARFGHIITELMESEPKYKAAKDIPEEKRTTEQNNTVLFFDNVANLRTLEFLERHNIFAKKREGLEPNEQANFKEYLVIPKFKA